MLDEHGLTPTRKQFADILPEVDYNASEAYRQSRNYPVTDGTAGVEGHRLLKDPKIQQYLTEQAAKHKITAGRVYEKLNQLMDHQHIIITPTGIIKDKDGNPVKEVDPAVQLKACDMAIRVLPEFVALKQLAGGEPAPGSQHLHLHAVPDKVLRRVAARVTNDDQE